MSTSPPSSPGPRNSFGTSVIYPYLVPTESPDSFEYVELFHKVRTDLYGPDGSGRMKRFRYRYRTAPNHVWIPTKPRGADSVIYNLPAVLEARRESRTIYWAEGEKDADALIVAGVVATSHHGGATNIFAQQAAWLRGHRGRLVLLYDLDPDDPRGGNPGAADVMRRYTLLREAGIARSQIVVAHAREGKDAADHLAAGYDVDQFLRPRNLAELTSKARRTTSATLRRSGYMPGQRLGDWGRTLKGGGSA